MKVSVFSLQGGRAYQEDVADTFHLNGVFFACLCDGLGGEPNGGDASLYFVASFRDAIRDGRPFPQAWRMAAFDAARTGGKTTAICLQIEGANASGVYIGDSHLQAFGPFWPRGEWAQPRDEKDGFVTHCVGCSESHFSPFALGEKWNRIVLASDGVTVPLRRGGARSLVQRSIKKEGDRADNATAIVIERK